jgi:hypothetical protein
MRNWISARRAGLFALILLALLAIFHLLVLVRIIPTGMVWGGEIEDKSAFIRMEILALVITLIFTIVIAIPSGYIRTRKLQKLAGIGVWVVFAYFLLNILGNLMSENATEKAIFTPVSILLAIFTFRLAIEKRISQKTNHTGS